MKRCVLVCLVLAVASNAVADLASEVDPFIGCADNGHCFAAAAYPMGMVQAGPDTGNTWWDYCSGYRFADTNIIGFSQTHLSGTGCGDLGDVRVMPVKGGLGSLGGLACAKSEEVAEPGYYAVTLKDAAVRVEIAAAKHAAIYRFKSLDADLPRLLVDLQYGILNWSDKTGVDRVVSCEVRREGDCRIVGSMRTKMWVERVFHFVLDFNRPIAAWEDLPKRDERERGRRFVLGFDGKGEGPLMMRFGISANSVAAAKANLSVEIPDWDLTTVRTATREAWNRILSRVEIEGTDGQKRTFYTSLYHLYIQPNDIADVGCEPYYSTFSTWDTFRAAHPLYTILSPEYVDGFVNSMLKDWRRRGYLPIWTLWGEDNQCMIGTHSVPIIVDWFLKSGGGPLRTTGPTVAVDWQEAYAAVKDTLTRKHVGRSFEPWDMLVRYGYIPFDKVGSESVSRTLEFAYDDWCAARFAEALGKKEDAAFFDRRAFAWTNVFDRTTCLMRGRDSSGSWRDPFNPFKLNVGGNGEGAKDFTEGNSWQYSWHVMQHPQELIALHGGREKFADHLDRLFSLPEKAEGMGFALDATGLIGQYAHGNEPSHHTAYFFSLAGRPDRTAEIVREVCERFYQPQPDGLCGNDDCGQMSAWYLFSAMGFYPFNPCGGEYVIGAPQVSKVTLRVCSPSSKSESENGIANIHSTTTTSNYDSFTIIAKGLSKENKYVKSVTLNGKPIADWKIRHADIMAGGELVFEMCGPNKNTDPLKRVVEGGIEKFVAGRTPEEARASGDAAYGRSVSEEIIRVDETMTLAELNRRELKPGTKVLFRRGGVWRGQIVAQSGKPGHPIVYGAYGEGPKPCIQPSYDGADAAKWKKVGEDLWQIDVGAGNDIGNVIMNRGGEDAPAPNMCCFKRQTLAELKNDLDFCCEKGTWLVTMRSAANPATRFKSVELCEKIHCVDETWAHDVVYEGLHFRYSAAHGIGGSNTKRITVRGCDISWIGGGYLYYDKKGNGVRYGNGVEFWSAAEGHVIESNRVWECWDAGLTNQSSEDDVVQKDIVWRGNEVWNCEYSYEYWQQGANAQTWNVSVENNICRDAGKGWGHKQRWNPNAAHLMFYDTTAETKGFVVKNNVFSRSEDCLFRLFNDWRKNLTMVENKWVADKEPICRYHGRPTKDLIYKYPDRLDQMHDDNLAEIQSQGSGARVFKADELDAFLKFMEAK